MPYRSDIDALVARRAAVEREIRRLTHDRDAISYLLGDMPADRRRRGTGVRIAAIASAIIGLAVIVLTLPSDDEPPPKHAPQDYAACHAATEAWEQAYASAQRICYPGSLPLWELK